MHFSIVKYLFLVRFEPLRLQRSATFHVLGDKEGLVHTMYLCCVIGSGWYSGRQLLLCQAKILIHQMHNMQQIYVLIYKIGSAIS